VNGYMISVNLSTGSKLHYSLNTTLYQYGVKVNTVALYQYDVRENTVVGCFK